MTDMTVGSVAYQVERRSWLLGPHGTEPGATPSITLDVSAFTAATHYPNGYIMSGIVLGRITATGLYAPMLAANSDGSQTAVGILFGSVKVPNLLDLTKDVGGAMLVHGFVDAAKLPIANGATGGGFITTAGRAALNLISFAN
jgi:head decoration protein D